MPFQVSFPLSGIAVPLPTQYCTVGLIIFLAVMHNNRSTSEIVD
jgi:hypothetical protein